MIRKWLMRAMKVGIMLVIVSVVGLHVLDMWMYADDDEIVAMFKGSATQVMVDHKLTQAGDVRVLVEQVEQGDSTLIVFVHGAPGSCDAFKMYMLDDTVARHGQLIAYDRPGYSRGSKSTPSITEQAEVLMSIVREHKLPHVVLVGHSYGGPIVAKCLATYPMEVDKAVMIAPVNDPDHEPMFWFAYFSKWKFSKWLLPNSFQVAGDEKFAHAQELEKMKADWNNIKRPILHIHGTTDALAPAAENIAWSKTNIPPRALTIIVMPRAGHLVLWQEYEEVRDHILSFL